MKKFDIEVVETLSRVIAVNAENFYDAVYKVEKMYNDEEIILDYNDKKLTEFKNYNDLENVINLDYLENDKDFSLLDDKLKQSISNCNSYQDLFNTFKIIIDDSNRKAHSDRIKFGKKMKQENDNYYDDQQTLEEYNLQSHKSEEMER